MVCRNITDISPPKKKITVITYFNFNHNLMNLSKISVFAVLATMLNTSAVADITAIQSEALNEYYKLQDTGFFMGMLIGCGQVYQDMRPEVNATLIIMVPKFTNEQIAESTEKIDACMEKAAAPTRNQCSTLNKLLANKVSFRNSELEDLGIAGMPMVRPCFF